MMLAGRGRSEGSGCLVFAERAKIRIFTNTRSMNIAQTLKAEIARVSRKEIKAEAQPLKKSSAIHRSDIDALKRRLADLERKVKALETSSRKKPKLEADPIGKQIRFSNLRFAALRQKLSLSAADLGLLLGVSGATVYNWESGKSRPRPAQLQAIAVVRGFALKEVEAHLATARASK